MRAIVPNRNYFKPIILKFETFIYNSGSKITYNVSKYAKTMVEPYICDNSNHNYRFFFIFNKKILKLENYLEGIRLISFVHV